MPRKEIVSKLRIALFAIAFGLFISLAALVGVLILVVRNNSSEVELRETSAVYRLYRFNPTTNISSSGLVGVNEIDFNKESFLHYETENNIHFLISNFGDTEYRCYGKCFCTEYTQRRSTSIVLSKSVLYLAAAIGSLIAYDHAKAYFESKCVSEISCDGEITSEVDHCESVNEEEIENDNIVESVDSETKKKSKFYQCRGSCLVYENDEEYLVNSNFLLDIDVRRREVGKELGCEDLQISEVFEYSFEEFGYILNQPLSTQRIEGIERYFVMNDLHSFCKSQSVRDISVISEFHEGQEMFHRSHVCIGYKKMIELGNPFYNPSVHCVENK